MQFVGDYIFLLAAGLLLGAVVAERPSLHEGDLHVIEVKAHGHLKKQTEGRVNKTQACFCVFDIDRTLTGKQSQTSTCTKNQEVHGVWDTAYGSGTLTLSEVGQQIGSTFCKSCYLGIVSAGTGSAQAERTKLVQQLQSSGGKLVSQQWVGPSSTYGHRQRCSSDVKYYPSTLAVGCDDGSKQEAVRGMVTMLNTQHAAGIEDSNVWHFDDRVDNIDSFAGTGFNAKQISCRYRDGNGGNIGLCGAALKEVTNDDKGTIKCPPPGPCEPGGSVWVHSVEGHTCGDRITWVMDKEHLDEDAAKTKIAGQYPSDCGECKPSTDETDEEKEDGSEKNPDGGSGDSLPAGDTNNDPHYTVIKGMKVVDGHGGVDVEGPKAGLSSQACQEECSQASVCDCATYKSSTKECWLKKDCCKEGFVPDPDFSVFWVKDNTDNKPDPEYKVYKDKNAYAPFGAVDLPLDAKHDVGVKVCQQWCSDTENCDCMTYSVQGRTCWLRKQCSPEGWTSSYNKGYDVYVKQRLANGPTPAPPPPGDCKTATRSNGMRSCYDAATWARNNGVKSNPSTYGGLSAASPFEDFQNFLFKDSDQQGCTTMACPPPPGPPQGTTIIVSKGLGSRGNDKIRISLVRYAGEVIPDSGSVQWTYKSQFLHKWTNFHIKTALVSITPGTPTSFNVDGSEIVVKIPKQTDGSVGLIMADPCITSSCQLAGKHQTKETIQDMLHSLRLKDSLDYWVTVGDNFYDQSGGITADFFGGLSLNASSVLFGATMGNHDFWIGGSPGAASNRDTFGNGHIQWYAQDAMSAKADDKKPFDLSKKPWSIVDVSNTFWYNSVGTQVLIGFSNNYGYGAMEGYFKEACAYAGQVNPALILLLGHWSWSGFGCPGGSETSTIWRKVKELPGCKNKRVKYVIGHTHTNKQMGDGNFMLGSWGYGHERDGGQFGLSFFDTRGGKARLHYFELAYQGGRKSNDWDATMNCLKEKGIDGCTSLPTHKLWMDETIQG